MRKHNNTRRQMNAQNAMKNREKRKMRKMEEFDEALRIAKILDTTNPDETQLEKHIETYDKITKQNHYAFLPEILGYKIKLKAMKATVNGVTATMTPIQLLQIGDVNWARGLSPKNITEVAENYSRSLKISKEKEFFELYNDVLLSDINAPASYEVSDVMGYKFYNVDVDYDMWLN